MNLALRLFVSHLLAQLVQTERAIASLRLGLAPFCNPDHEVPHADCGRSAISIAPFDIILDMRLLSVD